MVPVKCIKNSSGMSIFAAEATVREANACRLNELGRRGLMRVVIHKKSPGIADEDVQPVAND
jgi:hypothetical protein